MIQYSQEAIRKLFKYKIVRYAFVGGISTFIHIFVAALYIYYISESLLQSNIIGFLFAYIFSYTVQSLFVFEHEISAKKAAKYFIVQFSALLLAIVLSNLFESYNVYIRTVIVVVLLPFITFITHKFWTFKTSPH